MNARMENGIDLKATLARIDRELAENARLREEANKVVAEQPNVLG